MFMRIIAVIVAATMWAGAASARDLTPLERAALDEKVLEFSTALRRGDFETLVGGVPRPFIAVLANVNGITDEEMEAAMREAIAQLFSAVKIERIEFEGSDYETFTETSTGLVYGFAEVEIQVLYGPDRYEVTSYMLALLDRGEWHIVRIEARPTHALLIEAYPSLADMPFLAEVVEPM